MEINTDVDMHVILAPVSYNNFSLIAGLALISIRGLLSLVLVKSKGLFGRAYVFLSVRGVSATALSPW